MTLLMLALLLLEQQGRTMVNGGWAFHLDRLATLFRPLGVGDLMGSAAMGLLDGNGGLRMLFPSGYAGLFAWEK
jgi:hypothetical protein